VLDEQQLGDYIDRHFEAAGTLFRLEVLDHYNIDSDGDDLARYLAGEPGPDMRRKGPWMDQIRSEVARGLHTCRVHVVRGSLTPYLRFEFEWGYTCNSQAGEQIRILDLSEQPEPAGLVNEDFWLAGDAHAALMRYDDTGRFLGADIADPAAVPRYRAARDAAWSAATPFDAYWAAHPQHWRDRRAA
jgi:hypothetical protein